MQLFSIFFHIFVHKKWYGDRCAKATKAAWAGSFAAWGKLQWRRWMSVLQTQTTNYSWE